MCIKKTLGIAAVALPLAGLAAYGFAWKKYSDKLQNDVMAYAEQHKLGKLSYESAEKSGFPFNIRITLHNPALSVDAERVVKQHLTEYYNSAMTSADAKKPSGRKAAFGDWQENIAVDGDAVIETAPFSKNFTVKTNGVIRHTSRIDDRSFSSVFTPDENAAIDFSVDHHDRKSLFWDDAAQAIKEKYPLAARLRRLDARLGGEWNTTDKDGKEVAISACLNEEVFFDDKGADAFDVRIAQKDCDEFAAGHKLARKHYARLFPRQIPGNFERVFNEGDVIGANFTFDASGARESGNIVAVTFNDFAYSDAMQETGAKGVVRRHAAPEGEKYDVDITSSSKILPEFYNDRREKLTKFFANYAANDKDWNSIKKDIPFGFGMWLDELRKQDPSRFAGVAAQNIFQLFPKLHELGEIKTHIDATIDATPRAGGIEVRKFSFDSDPYSIELVRESAAGDTKEAQYRITLRQYEKMTGDAVAYAKKLLQATKRMGISNGNYRIKTGMDGAIVTLLRDVAGSQDDPLNITLAITDAGLRVGTLKGAEAMQRAMIALMPFVEMSPPAAAAPLAPSEGVAPAEGAQ